MPTEVRAAIYGRVSSDLQEKEQTIRSHLEGLRKYVLERGYVIAGEYIDDGYSGVVPAMAPRFAEMNDNIINRYEKNIINLDEVRDHLHLDPVTDGNGGLYFGDFSRTPTSSEPPS